MRLDCAGLAATLLLATAIPFAAVSRPVPAANAANPFSVSGPLVQGSIASGRIPSDTLRLSLDGQPVRFDAAGRFIIGFDRDHGRSAALVAERANGPPIRQELGIAPRSWKIERINQDRPKTGPTPAYKIIRDAELARIATARAIETGSMGWKQTFILPARGRISGRFGSQRIYRGGVPAAFHSGLDIAPGAGKPVVAPADGVVVLAGPPAFSLEGNLVIVDHGFGLSSAFLHLATSLVQVGQKVVQGQQIGTVGASGRATGPHLHWSVRWRTARLDPLMLVSATH